MKTIINKPHFDRGIFEGITGIWIEDYAREDDIIETNGKKYKLINGQ
jgi:hypothetical protein